MRPVMLSAAGACRPPAVVPDDGCSRRHESPRRLRRGLGSACGVLRSAHPHRPCLRQKAARTAAAGEMREHGAGRCRIWARESMETACPVIPAIQDCRGDAVDLPRRASTIAQIRRTLRERPAVTSRRRRRNRPGNAQANGPQGDETLESSRAVRQGLTDGVSRPACIAARAAAKSLRFRDRGGSDG